MPPTLGRVLLAKPTRASAFGDSKPFVAGIDGEAGLQHLAKLYFGEPKPWWECLVVMINEWGKYEEKIKTCDFGPKTVCYIERNRHFGP